jgi:hypothetical protein
MCKVATLSLPRYSELKILEYTDRHHMNAREYVLLMYRTKRTIMLNVLDLLLQPLPELFPSLRILRVWLGGPNLRPRYEILDESMRDVNLNKKTTEIPCH